MIHQVAAISDQDVEELEKLARNFPYCQTAHLLIAKASYDQGNMLSNQKLRKAAAYAINRHLLKKLIYTTQTAVVLTEINPVTAELELNVAEPETAPVEESTLIKETSPVEAEMVTEFLLPAPKSDYTNEPVTSEIPADLISAPESSSTPVSETEISAEEAPLSDSKETPEPSIDNIPDYELNIPAQTSEISQVTNEIPTDEPEKFSHDSEPGHDPIVSAPEPESTFSWSELDDLLQVQNLTRPSLLANETPDIPSIPTPDATEIPASDLVLPPAEPQNIPVIRYELEAADEPEEVALEQTLARFDSYLFKPEKDEPLVGDLKPATPEEFIYEVYTRNSLGYWMGSSRLGEVLQVKDELTTSTPLQFYPDLILEYSKQNYLTPTDPPPVTKVSRQLEIIDQFLKANPKLKSFAPDKVRPESHDDLAFKSTKNTKNLASENLANIMVQQGKIKKAIKIYEHLVLKIPEKRAYFTAQIEKLRNLI